MDQYRLTGHQIEGVVLERELLDRGGLVPAAVGQAALRRPGAGQVGEVGLDVDAVETHRVGQSAQQGAAPVPGPAAHVENAPDVIHAPAVEHEGQEVRVPPGLAPVAVEAGESAVDVRIGVLGLVHGFAHARPR